ncbi:uncharacterized protein LOC114253256 [Bombyx mandarina]|uniref:Uncharacterized protein n=2 Tax=Bombyx TaxID=7090 RepID=A0A8R1WGS3_BOMMO|nr:uncharacterized protein LOC101742240 [Bombyx mori]XP_028043857.1 uncharacterized protein LOC114253256 [Bombyx mandarina]
MMLTFSSQYFHNTQHCVLCGVGSMAGSRVIVGGPRQKSKVVHPYQFLLTDRASITRTRHIPTKMRDPLHVPSQNHSRSRLLPPPPGKSREEGLTRPSRHSIAVYRWPRASSNGIT